MAQWLRTLTALPKDLCSIPSSYTAAHNHPKLQILRDPTSFSDLCVHQACKCTDIHSGKTPIHIKKQKQNWTVMAYAFNPSTLGEKAKRSLNKEASLAYRVSSRTARAMRRPSLNIKNQNKRLESCLSG